jgi:hypothetical protein
MVESAQPSAFIVFDLDGTLININSITHLIGDWEAFHQASLTCPSNEPMVEFARRCQRLGEIIICTGKGEEYRKQTNDWLSLRGILPDLLLMRPKLNDMSDALLKPWLMERHVGADWKERTLFVVEDRDKAVNAWRALGVTCLQCAESLY